MGVRTHPADKPSKFDVIDQEKAAEAQFEKVMQKLEKRGEL